MLIFEKNTIQILKMKKALSILLFIIVSIATPSFSQTLGETAVKEILVKKFNEQLPKILGDGQIMKGLNLGMLKIYGYPQN